MDKFIIIKFMDYKYLINTRYVAKHRADMYKGNIEDILDDEQELLYHLWSKMKWREVEPNAIAFEVNIPEETNKEECFELCDIEIIDEKDLPITHDKFVELWMIKKLKAGLRLGQIVENVKKVCKQEGKEDIFYISNEEIMRILDKRLP